MITFTGQLVSPVNLSSTILYSGTVLTLTCVVELVPEVDTTVTVSTTWSKDGMDIISDGTRITVDSIAASHDTNIYESDVIFNPLSNMMTVDDGLYTCSVQVEDDVYIIGSSNDGTQTLTVEGQYRRTHDIVYIIRAMVDALYVGMVHMCMEIQTCEKASKLC